MRFEIVESMHLREDDECLKRLLKPQGLHQTVLDLTYSPTKVKHIDLTLDRLSEIIIKDTRIDRVCLVDV